VINDRLDQVRRDGVGDQVGHDTDNFILRGGAAARRCACLAVMQPAPDGIGAAQQSIDERAIDDDGLRGARAVAVA
jgi:hypothetical protein